MTDFHDEYVMDNVTISETSVAVIRDGAFVEEVHYHKLLIQHILTSYMYIVIYKYNR